MRTAEETLALFKQVIENRRAYVREKYHSIQCNGREQQPLMEQMLRGGMLSELTTMEAALTMIERGEDDPLQYWTEASESTEPPSEAAAE